MTVQAGQIVAFAGDSGNAEGTASHLHFEIHQPDGTAVNPYPSLRIAQGYRYGPWCAFDTNPKRRPSATSAPGYWALGADGGVFSFGAAAFYGSTGGQVLNKPAVAMTAVPGDTVAAAGGGYWFTASDGGIFAFGDAGFLGSVPATGLCEPPKASRIMASSTGKGYWVAAADGSVFPFGDAADLGSPKALGLTGLAPVLDLVAVPTPLVTIKL